MGSQYRGTQEIVERGAAVVVEVLALRVTGEKEVGTDALAFRVLTGELNDGRHPDAVARELLGLSHDTAAHLLHSTSWRHDPSGRVLLTYACCPDPRPDLAAVPLTGRGLAYGDGPASPSPGRPRIEQVAAHAVRHLAFLWYNDAAARRVIDSVEGLAAILALSSPAPAGQFPEPGTDGWAAFASR
ncbi:hypothetical protein D0T12_03610 [Actinomadura spongiicola]|uniref:Uncharacterized protein n=1 Tax=Actinomadura spongiicola TaxID=2303421 RepID=A0A372GQA2_9ACTN|nr:hypothetical protein [Actinomadura spongiicola]RFS87332.1 hypothetical protein D0T12_03610 [Actinomadura spongiicola]